MLSWLDFWDYLSEVLKDFYSLEQKEKNENFSKNLFLATPNKRTTQITNQETITNSSPQESRKKIHFTFKENRMRQAQLKIEKLHKSSGQNE